MASFWDDIGNAIQKDTPQVLDTVAKALVPNRGMDILTGQKGKKSSSQPTDPFNVGDYVNSTLGMYSVPTTWDTNKHVSWLQGQGASDKATVDKLLQPYLAQLQPSFMGGAASSGQQTDPLAMQLMFSTLIQPYMQQLTQSMHNTSDAYGHSMNEILNNGHLTPGMSNVIRAGIPGFQANMNNIADTNAAAVASGPGITDLMNALTTARSAQIADQVERAKQIGASSPVSSIGGLFTTPTTPATPAKK